MKGMKIKVTTIGMKFATLSAISLLGYLKEQFYQKRREQLNLEITMKSHCNERRYNENSWKMYLDESFIIWAVSLHKLEEFNMLLNNLHPFKIIEA